MSLSFHSIHDASNIPENVEKIVSLLKGSSSSISVSQLAQWQSISPIALAHLRRSPPDLGNAETLEASDRLYGVLDSVLSISAGMHQLVEDTRCPQPRQLASLWHTFLGAVGRACHENARILGEVPCIYPKGFQHGHGTAAALLIFSADDSILAANVSGQKKYLVKGGCPPCRQVSHGLCDDASRQSSIDGWSCTDSVDVSGEINEHTLSSDYDSIENHPIYTATDDIWMPEYDEADLLFGFNEIDEHEPPEGPWLDLPPGAHIRAERKPWLSVSFPILCVGSEETIAPLMSSAVYQRRTWDMDLPVVGLQISQSCSLARVHIGWGESLSDDAHSLSMHILRPEDGVYYSSGALTPQGIFDLASPRSALALARFILLLDYQFQAFQGELPSRLPRMVKWRSDEEERATWPESVEAWRLLARSDWSYGDGDHSASTTHSGSDPQMSDKTRAQAALGRDQRRAVPSVRTQSSGSDARPSASDEAGSSAQESIIESRKSCSEFAARMPFKAIGKQATTATWMLFRNVFSVATVAPSSEAEGKLPDLQSMIDLYETYTAFEWVENWVSTDTMPSVDKCVARFPNILFQQYKDLARSIDKPRFLEPGLSAIIGSRLTTLFNVVAGAMVKREQDEDQKLYEAELRLLWDEMLTTFSVNHAEEVISRDVYLERFLRLPRNTLEHQLSVDNSDDPVGVKSLKSRLNIIQQLNMAVTIQAKNIFKPTDPVLLHCYQASHATQDNDQQFNSLSASHSHLRKTLQKQAQAEPYRGKCDAVMVTSFTINATTNDASFLRSYGAFSLLNVDSEDTQGDEQTKTAEEPSKQDTTTDAKNKKNYSYHHPLSVVAPNPVANVAFEGDPPFKIPPKTKSLAAVELLVPQFFAEYKKSNTEEIKALNQDRMYMTSAASFLRAINILGYPIFSVVTNGLVGAVLMAWASTDGGIYIMERGVRHFNLSDPLQAFHFATVVVRVKARDEELRKLLDARKEDLELQLSTGTYEAWAMPDPPPRRPKSAKQPDEQDTTSTSTSKSARTRSKLDPVDEEDIEMLTKQMKATHVSRKRT